MQGKVDASHKHEKYYYRFDIYRIKKTNTRGMSRKAASCKGSKRMADSVKKADPAKYQEEYLRDREQDINRPEYSGSILNPGCQSVFGRPGHLSLKKLHAADTEQRQNSQGEDDDPHAAKPMCQGAPEENAFGQNFHPGQDG